MPLQAQRLRLRDRPQPLTASVGPEPAHPARAVTATAAEKESTDMDKLDGLDLTQAERYRFMTRPQHRDAAHRLMAEADDTERGSAERLELRITAMCHLLLAEHAASR